MSSAKPSQNPFSVFNWTLGALCGIHLSWLCYNNKKNNNNTIYTSLSTNMNRGEKKVTHEQFRRSAAHQTDKSHLPFGSTTHSKSTVGTCRLQERQFQLISIFHANSCHKVTLPIPSLSSSTFISSISLTQVKTNATMCSKEHTHLHTLC